MGGSLSSLVGETYVCYGELASCWCSSIDRVLVLDGEVCKGLTIDRSSVVEMSIFACYISYSCSPAPKSFLELSLWGCVPNWSRNSVSRVLLASWSPSYGFGIRTSEFGAYVSPCSSYCVISTGVIRQASEPSSLSYMVIKSTRTVGIHVLLDALVDLHWAIVVIGDPACGDLGLGFSWSVVSPSGIAFELVGSTSSLSPTEVILKGPIK